MRSPDRFPESLAKLREFFASMPELRWNEKDVKLSEKFDGITFLSAGGACPVQAQGSYQDMEFYFRYRHGEASLGWGADPIRLPEYEDVLPYGDTFDGYMTVEEFEDVFSNLMYNLIRQKAGYPNGN